MCDQMKSLQLPIKATWAVYWPNEIVCQMKLKKKESGLHPFDENAFYLVMKMIVNNVRTVERKGFCND
jgi:hypothetical protein